MMANNNQPETPRHDGGQLGWLRCLLVRPWSLAAVIMTKYFFHKKIHKKQCDTPLERGDQGEHMRDSISPRK